MMLSALLQHSCSILPLLTSASADHTPEYPVIVPTVCVEVTQKDHRLGLRYVKSRRVFLENFRITSVRRYHQIRRTDHHV